MFMEVKWQEWKIGGEFGGCNKNSRGSHWQRLRRVELGLIWMKKWAALTSAA